MMVLLLEKVSDSLRGELTRWLLEPRNGVFVGAVSSLVREKLWEKVLKELRPSSGALLIYNTNDEQGYRLESRGELRRRLIERSGIQLIQRDLPNPEKNYAKLRAWPGPHIPRRPWHPTLFSNFTAVELSEEDALDSSERPEGEEHP